MEQPTLKNNDFMEGLRRTYEKPLQDYLTQLVGSTDVAQTLSQDSFERVRKTCLEEETIPFPRAFLFKVATDFALRHFRAKSLRRLVPEAAASQEDTPDASTRFIHFPPKANTNHLSACLVDAIKALRPGLREVFVLANVQGVPREEIAARLSLSAAQVDWRMTQSLKTVRGRLEAKGIDLARLFSLFALLMFTFLLGWH